MKPLVIDASVAAKWFLPEDGADRARALLDPKHRLIAPDLLWIEVAAVAWKAVRRGALGPAEAEQVVRDTQLFPVETHDSVALLPGAIRLAIELDRTIYDCVYLALAIAEDGVVLTADERFTRAVGRAKHARRIRLLPDWDR